MTQSIPEPISFATVPAGVAALMHWYPDVSRRVFDRLREAQPGYPLICGGGLRGVALARCAPEVA